MIHKMDTKAIPFGSSTGTHPQWILMRAMQHIIERHETNSMMEIYRKDVNDYGALRILEACYELVTYG
jgi:hypothetical protein